MSASTTTAGPVSASGRGTGSRHGPPPATPFDLIAAPAAHPPGAVVPISGLDLLAPVPKPGKVVCIGLNYRKHAEEGGNPIPDYPAVFLRGLTSLVAHGKPMLRPPCSDKLDYEAELAVVIGRAATRVARGRCAGACRGLCLLQRRIGAGLPATLHAVDHGQETSTAPAASAPTW